MLTQRFYLVIWDVFEPLQSAVIYQDCNLLRMIGKCAWDCRIIYMSSFLYIILHRNIFQWLCRLLDIMFYIDFYRLTRMNIQRKL